VWGKQKRGWDFSRARRLFPSALIILAFLISSVLVYTRVMGGGGSKSWDSEQYAYSQIFTFLHKHELSPNDVVVVANPPGFYLTSGNPTIAVPDGDIQTLIAVARKYNAKYVILEAASTPGNLLSVYQNPTNQAHLSYLGAVEEAHIYAIQP
jgi:hypothetical protein